MMSTHGATDIHRVVKCTECVTRRLCIALGHAQVASFETKKLNWAKDIWTKRKFVAELSSNHRSLACQGRVKLCLNAACTREQHQLIGIDC